MSASTSRTTGQRRRVITAEHAYMISDILSDPSAQCITFGCGGLNVPGYRVAVKTGTSEPFDPRGPNRRQDRRDLGLRLSRPTTWSASGPATRTTRRSSTSSARRSRSGRCATSCSRPITAARGVLSSALLASYRGRFARLLRNNRASRPRETALCLRSAAPNSESGDLAYRRQTGREV